MRALAIAVLATVVARAQEAQPSYWRDVRPILQQRCQGCHQPAKAEGDVVLTTHAALVSGDDPVVLARDASHSRLIEAVSKSGDDAPAMPKDGAPLREQQIAVLCAWIAAGAVDDSPPSGPSVSAEHPPVYEHLPVVTSLAFAPDGRLLAVSGYHEVLLHRTDGSGLEARLVGLSERIQSLAFAPDGRSLAVAGGSPGRLGELQIWNVPTRTLRVSVPAGFDCAYGASWSPDGRLCAFGCADTTVRAVDASTGAEVLYQGAHDDWVLGTVFSTDGSHLVTVSRDRSMKLIAVATSQFIDNITSITPGALKGGLLTVDRRPGADELLTGGADGVPRVYRMYREKDRKIGDDFNLIRAFRGLPGRVFAARFSPDGTRIAVAASDRGTGQVRVYDVADGRLVWSHATIGGVYALTWHPSGTLLACGGFDGIVELIDARTGWLVQQLVPVPLAASPHATEGTNDVR
jgi:WD40 repeat protein